MTSLPRHLDVIGVIDDVITITSKWRHIDPKTSLPRHHDVIRVNIPMTFDCVVSLLLSDIVSDLIFIFLKLS